MGPTRLGGAWQVGDVARTTGRGAMSRVQLGGGRHTAGSEACAGAGAQRGGGMSALSWSVVGPGRPSRERATGCCLTELFSYLFSLY